MGEVSFSPVDDGGGGPWRGMVGQRERGGGAMAGHAGRRERGGRGQSAAVGC